MAFGCKFLLRQNATQEQLRCLGDGLVLLLKETQRRKRRRRMYVGSRRAHRSGHPIRYHRWDFFQGAELLAAGQRPESPIRLVLDMRALRQPQEPLAKDAGIDALTRRVQLKLQGPPPASREELISIIEQLVPLDAIADVIIDGRSWLCDQDRRRTHSANE